MHPIFEHDKLHPRGFSLGAHMQDVSADDVSWAVRNEHWLSRDLVPRRYSARWERSTRPLVLCGHGASLRVDKGSLLIRDGFTHWPQERIEYRLFKGARDLPPRIVMLDGSGSLSFDVLTWLSEQNLPLIRLDYQGDVVSVIGGTGFAMKPDKLLWQVETRNDPERRLAFSCQLIKDKLSATLRTLQRVIPSRPERDAALARTEATVARIDAGQFKTVDELRIAEAICAASYFTAWQGLPLRWRQKVKHPIPDAWLTIGPRNTLGKKGRYLSNRNARHPVNAVLNYAYGMLRSQVHIEAVAAGFDPRRGVMHHDRDDGDAFAWVFDMIEPRRAEVDGIVLKFMLDTPLKGADFVLRSDGVCRLVPQLARRVAELV